MCEFPIFYHWTFGKFELRELFLRTTCPTPFERTKGVENLMNCCLSCQMLVLSYSEEKLRRGLCRN